MPHTPADRIATLRRWYSEYARRRGGDPPPPLTEKETVEAVKEGLSLLHIPLRKDVEAGAVRDGLRMLARPVTAVFVSSVDTDKAQKILKLVESLHKGSDVDIVGEQPALNQTVPKKMAEHGASRKVTVRYLHFSRFCTDITGHAHVAPLRHYLPDREEIDSYLRFTFTSVSSLSILSAHDPQCIWLGARGGDVVGVREVRSNAHTVNYYQVVAARLGVRGIR